VGQLYFETAGMTSLLDHGKAFILLSQGQQKTVRKHQSLEQGTGHGVSTQAASIAYLEPATIWNWQRLTVTVQNLMAVVSSREGRDCIVGVCVVQGNLQFDVVTILVIGVVWVFPLIHPLLVEEIHWRQCL
jgi:hypothetical protein